MARGKLMMVAVGGKFSTLLHGCDVSCESVRECLAWRKIYLSVNFDIALTRMLAAAGENEMKLFQLNTHTSTLLLT